MINWKSDTTTPHSIYVVYAKFPDEGDDFFSPMYFSETEADALEYFEEVKKEPGAKGYVVRQPLNSEWHYQVEIARVFN